MEFVIGTVDKDSRLVGLNFMFLWRALFFLGRTLYAVRFGIGNMQGGLIAGTILLIGLV